MAGHDHTVSSARFMPGDQFIVSASRDRTIRIFDVSSTFVIRLVLLTHSLTLLMVRHLVRTISGHSDWVRYVEPSIDGKLLVSGSNDQVIFVPSLTVLHTEAIQTARLWDPLTGEMKMEFRGHDHIIEIAVFAPAVAYPAIRELAGLPVRVASRDAGQFPYHLTDKRQVHKACLVCRHCFTRQNDKTLGLSDRTNAKKSCLFPTPLHSPLPKRISPYRLATITGYEPSSSTRQANSSSPPATITPFGCGSCPQEGVSRWYRPMDILSRHWHGDGEQLPRPKQMPTARLPPIPLQNLST